MFSLLWKKKFLIVFLIALIALLPQAAARPAQMLSKTLFTSIGIDKTDDEYEISGEMIVNDFSKKGETKSEVISETGANITEVMNKLSAAQGREISLAHCTLMVVGAGLNDENLGELLTYFFHKTEVNNNCAIVYTQSPVKDLLTASEEGGDKRRGLLQQILEFNQQNIIGKPTSLEKFFKDYMRTSKTGILTTATLEGDKISNEIQAAVFKNGKHVFTLDETQTLALNFLNSKNTKMRTIQDDVTLHVLAKGAKIKVHMENGHPVVKINVKTTVRVEDIKGQIILNLDAEKQAQIKTALQQKLKSDIENTLAQMKVQKTDFLHLYDKYYRKYRVTQTIEDFLDTLEFQIKVDASVMT